MIKSVPLLNDGFTLRRFEKQEVKKFFDRSCRRPGFPLMVSVCTPKGYYESCRDIKKIFSDFHSRFGFQRSRERMNFALPHNTRLAK
jgi:hypothetical protein